MVYKVEVNGMGFDVQNDTLTWGQIVSFSGIMPQEAVVLIHNKDNTRTLLNESSEVYLERGRTLKFSVMLRSTYERENAPPTAPFIRDFTRYIVLKRTDLKAYAKSPHDLEVLARIVASCAEGREMRGAKPLECVVIESEWPEYEQVWSMLETRVTHENRKRAQVKEYIKNILEDQRKADPVLLSKALVEYLTELEIEAQKLVEDIEDIEAENV